MALRAVLFDLGGVVVESPFAAIRAFEVRHHLPLGFINSLIATTGSEGAWARLERGELDMDSFYSAFEAEAAAAGVQLSAGHLLRALQLTMQPRPAMLQAIQRIRARGLRTGAITNNWIDSSARVQPLREYFDVFIESARTGIRKPDPRIYELACRELRVRFDEAVFLDDIGANLKSARALGMVTIKVTDPNSALAELEGLLGFPLS